MTDERLQEIFESTSADVPDAHLIFGRAVAQAATLAERERVAELLDDAHLSGLAEHVRSGK